MARNAAATIGATIRSLFKQTLLRQAVATIDSVEVVVVANGCTDDTAGVARLVLAEVGDPHGAVEWRVCEVAQAGKSNAWNLYVHELSAPSAEHLFLLDSDIEFGQTETLARQRQILVANPKVWIATDRAIKHVARKGPEKSFKDHLSLAASRDYAGPEVWICGQNYAAPAAVLRKIWMPVGLPVEDGFLWQMIVTDRFTSPPVYTRVMLTPDASHYFEALTQPAVLFRHEKRITVGISINVMLREHLDKECGPQRDAGTLIKERNEKNIHWLKDFLREECGKRKWNVPGELFFRRFHSMGSLSPLKFAAILPFATAAFALDVLIFLESNKMLRRGSAFGYW